MDLISAPPLSPADNGKVKLRFDDAVASRDVRALSALAADEGPDSLVGKAAFKQINEIQSRAAEFKGATDPIDKAGPEGSPQRNIKIAQTFASTADQPLYGQALVAFVLGQKEDAYKLFTGGTVKTSVEYANDNGNILNVKANGLGEPISYYDTQEGRYLSPEEYSRRGGSVSSFDKTLAGISQLENRKIYNAAFQTEQESINNWGPTIDNLSPKIKYTEEWLNANKTDFPPEEWAKLLRTVSKNIGTASNVSSSKTAFDQLQKGANTADGIRVDAKIAAQTGAIVGQVLKISGDKLVSTDGKFSENLDRLKQKTDTSSQSKENSNNASETFNSIFQSEKFQNALKGKSEKDKQLFVQQLQQVLRFSNEIGTEMAQAVDKYGKPSFISLPTNADFYDPQALLMTQIAQHKYNKIQLSDYINYFNKNADLYKQTNTLPVPGAIANAFTKSGKYSENKMTWGQEIDKILNADFQARNQKPVALPASAVDVMTIPTAPATVPVTSTLGAAAASDRTTAAGREAAVPASAPPPAAPAAAAAPPPAPPPAPAAPAPEAAAAKLPAPKTGDRRVFEGKTYRFKGGDPNKQSNWTEVK
jgi:hypothetical protein